MTNRRTIYLITEGSYSTYRDLIAYDRKEDAEAAIAAGVGEDYHEVQVLNPGELPQKVTVYRAGINTRTFQVYVLTQDGWDFEQHPEFQDWSWRELEPHYRGTDKARVMRAAEDYAAGLRAMKTKTGGGGGRWVLLERPKPPKVDDHYLYWGEQPPELSARCRYWVRQIERGWRPNRKISGEGYDSQAEWYGVYIWELMHVLWPMLHSIDPNTVPPADDEERPHTPASVSVGFAAGGVVRGPGAADDDRVPFPLSGCMFSDAAQVIVVPEDDLR